jgi:hypothetical protein
MYEDKELHELAEKVLLSLVANPYIMEARSIEGKAGVYIYTTAEVAYDIAEEFLKERQTWLNAPEVPDGHSN